MSERICDRRTGRDKALRRIIAAEQVAEMDPAHLEIDEAAVDAVSAVASNLGFAGGDFSMLLATWLRPIAASGAATMERGRNRARCAVEFLAALLDGDGWNGALERSGLTGGQVTAFKFASPEFKKVFDAVLAISREARARAIGERVEDAALELATKGEEVFDKQGKVVGRRRNVKAVELLLPLAGPEYQKTGRAASAGGGAEVGGITLNFHFDGKGRPGAAEAVNV